MNTLGLPRYTAAYAGRLIDLRPERVRRWLYGYEFRYSTTNQIINVTRQDPVIERGQATEARHASFLDLIDLLFVKKFIEIGFSLQKIRRALDEAKDILDEHHFAQKNFFTDGSEIYLQLNDKGKNAPALLQLLSGGQWVIANIILQLATQIDFHKETGFAEKWYPLGRDKQIVIDPKICFGSPTIVGHGIRTENVFDLFIAENEETPAVSNWLNLAQPDILAAVSFEKSLTNAK